MNIFLVSVKRSLYQKYTNISQIISQNIFARLNWKLFKLSSVSVRDIKKVPILQVGGSTSSPPTPPVIRVVLLLTERFVESFFPNCI